jgi:glycosyltransferase involved in cell wall biosynthesis
MNNDTKLLLVAYQCAPGEGSVSQIGWHWFSRLAKKLPLTLVTHSRNRVHLPETGTEVIFIDTEWFAGPLYRLARRIFPRSEHMVFLVSQLDFFVFDRAARRMLKKKMREGRKWDLVHMVTPVSPSAATSLGSLGLPLIVGPWNGGMQSPAAFPHLLKQENSFLYPLRNLARIPSWLFGTRRRARVILTATEATDNALSVSDRKKSLRVLENGVDLSVFNPAPMPAAPSAKDPIRILFVGRLIPVKGVDMLLRAVERLRERFPVELVIAGDGPIAADLRALTHELDLEQCVRFTGNLTPSQVAGELAQCHLFCLPSVRESGGAVILEAMAAARPCIVVRYGGPAELVDDQVGTAIEPKGQEHVIAELERLMADAQAHIANWQLKGLAGRRRAETLYCWDAKIDFAIQLYRTTLGAESAPKGVSSRNQQLDTITL